MEAGTLAEIGDPSFVGVGDTGTAGGLDWIRVTGSTSRDAVHGAGGGLADDVAVAADGAAAEELDGA